MSERDCQHGQHARACPLCELQQQVAALAAQLAEAQESREAYRKMALLREAEATALREALVSVVNRYDFERLTRTPDAFRQLAQEIDRARALLGGQPPTGGQP